MTDGMTVVVDLRHFAGDQVGHRDALFRALVRQHRAAHRVADGPDVGNAGAAFIIDLDKAALVELDAGAVGQQTLGVGPTADRDDDLVDL